MVHTFLIDRNSLLNSIWLNLLTKDQLNGVQSWGVPVWERMPQGPGDGAAIENATRTYLGRLVPVSRAVRLGEDGVSMIWGCALEYPDFTGGWRDAAATVYLRTYPTGETERSQLSGDLKRALWRELHAITVVKRSDDNQLGGPFALGNASGRNSVDVVAGAMVYAPRKTTTILDTVESVLHVPAAMFADTGLRLYQAGVAFAESWGRKLNWAVSACHRELHDELDKAEFRDRGNLVKQKAASHYWTAIEQRVPALLSVVEDPAQLRPEGEPRDNWAVTDWGKALARAAREAYELACPRETPRQLKAYAFGLSVLFKPDASKDEQTEAEETDT
jgi:CRISPR system Cascade subunit CasA